MEACVRLTRGYVHDARSLVLAPARCRVSRRKTASPFALTSFSKIPQRFENANHRHGSSVTACRAHAKAFSKAAALEVGGIDDISFHHQAICYRAGLSLVFSASARSGTWFAGSQPSCTWLHGLMHTHRQAHGL